MNNLVNCSAKIRLSVKSDQLREKKDSPPDFQSVSLKIQEIRLCPFCGKELDGLICDCEDFKKSFKILQETYGDSGHKSILSYTRSRNVVKCERTMSSIEVKELKFSEDEINSLSQISLDFTGIPQLSLIYYCTLIHDVFFFLVKYEERVYAYAVKNINIKGFSFSLRIRSGKLTHSKTWKTIASFENWQQFCRIIQDL